MASNTSLDQQLTKKVLEVKSRNIFTDIRPDIYLYIMVIPTFLWFIIFKYIPMGGIVIAFQKYRLSMGMFGAGQWVGVENFQKRFADSYFWRSFWNTLIISFYVSDKPYPHCQPQIPIRNYDTKYSSQLTLFEAPEPWGQSSILYSYVL